jgi:carboxypeptidase C (cathepsin A)
MGMNLYQKIFLFAVLLTFIQSAVVINQLTGITDQNLVFSGNIAISETNNLFFTYYGVDNQKDASALKNYPLLVVVGRYYYCYCSPGSSAHYLSLASIGPLKLNNDMTLSANPNRLTTDANVIFIDLLGSGFSFAASPDDIPNDYKTYGAQLTKAINTFAS